MLADLFTYAVLAVAFTVVGIFLGRRSVKANLIADKIRAEIEEIRARTRSIGGG